jgi:hypothetical protein
MRKVLTAAVLGLALVSMGCAGSQKVDKGTSIRCPKCGVEFPAEEGMKHGS